MFEYDVLIIKQRMIKTLCYKNCWFILLWNNNWAYVKLVIKVNMIHYKNCEKKLKAWIIKFMKFLFISFNSKRMMFFMHETQNLIWCSIIYIITVIFADNAFKLKNLRSSVNLYNLKILNHFISLVISWKEKMKKMLLFQQAETIVWDFYITNMQSFTNRAFNSILKQLKRKISFKDRFSDYCLQKNTDNAINNKFSDLLKWAEIHNEKKKALKLFVIKS